MVRDNRLGPVQLFGAILPERWVGAAVIIPAVNEHWTEISAQVAWGRHGRSGLDLAW